MTSAPWHNNTTQVPASKEAHETISILAAAWPGYDRRQVLDEVLAQWKRYATDELHLEILVKAWAGKVLDCDKVMEALRAVEVRGTAVAWDLPRAWKGVVVVGRLPAHKIPREEWVPVRQAVHAALWTVLPEGAGVSIGLRYVPGYETVTYGPEEVQSAKAGGSDAARTGAV